MKVQAEYIWLDGAKPTAQLRSKTKIIEVEPAKATLDSFPEWGFDGSSTYQAEGHDSDCVLKPVAFVRDPIRRTPNFTYTSGGKADQDDMPNFLVMCEVFLPDGVTPHPTNTRAELRRVLDAGAVDHEPWFGIEQEYLLQKNGRPLGWPESGFPSPQGPFYCGVGASNVAGRSIVDQHMQACLDAGLLFEGVNFEVLLGQSEFQIGSGDPLTVSDHLWFARWLLCRIGEDHGVSVSLLPKPILGDWNGSGQHTNYSTAAMRMNPNEKESRPDGAPTLGLDAIYEACKKIGKQVPEHIAVYGADNHLRLTGKHETCDINTFRFGIADRGASIRIPRHVGNKGYGYLEDRRPAANADPYQVCTVILKTTCDLW